MTTGIKGFLKSGKHSPLLYQYLERWQNDSSSRVFAPLAEAYRKAGMIEEAIEIAREGLQIHPSFVGGRVALARALFDHKQYSQVVEELSGIVQEVPDNLVAQRLYADASIKLGRVSDALGAFKMLLYFVPHDREIAKIVEELEEQVYSQGGLVLRSDLASLETEGQFEIQNVAAVTKADPAYKRTQWIGRVERLQRMLQKVEKYKTETRS